MPRGPITIHWDDAADAKLFAIYLKTHPDAKIDCNVIAEEWGGDVNAQAFRNRIARIKRKMAVEGLALRLKKEETPVKAEKALIKTEESPFKGIAMEKAREEEEYAQLGLKSAFSTDSSSSDSPEDDSPSASILASTQKGKGKAKAKPMFELGPPEDDEEEEYNEKPSEPKIKNESPTMPKMGWFSTTPPKPPRPQHATLAIPIVRKKGGSAADELLRMATRSPARPGSSQSQASTGNGNSNDSAGSDSPGSSGSGIFHMELDTDVRAKPARTTTTTAGPSTPSKKRTTATTGGTSKPANPSGSNTKTGTKSSPNKTSGSAVKTGRVEKNKYYEPGPPRYQDPRSHMFAPNYYRGPVNPFTEMAEQFEDERAAQAGWYNSQAIPSARIKREATIDYEEEEEEDDSYDPSF